MSATDIARLQFRVSKILKDGETVTGALRRLAGSRKRYQGKGGGATKTSADDYQTNKEAFDELTEASTMLLESGETDVYSKERSYFLRAAAVYIDVDEVPTGGASTLGLHLTTKAALAYEEADEDMFGGNSDEEDKVNVEEPSTSIKPMKGEDQFRDWPIKELKRYCVEHGKTCDRITEKKDLISLAIECSKNKTPATAYTAPLGYVFDPRSKMWWSQESKMYFDSASGAFYNPQDQKWYHYDGQNWRQA